MSSDLNTGTLAACPQPFVVGKLIVEQPQVISRSVVQRLRRTTAATSTTKSIPTTRLSTTSELSSNIGDNKSNQRILFPNFLELTDIQVPPSPSSPSPRRRVKAKRQRSTSSELSACTTRIKGMCQHKTYLFALCGHTTTLQDSASHLVSSCRTATPTTPLLRLPDTAKHAGHKTTSYDTRGGSLEGYLTWQEGENTPDAQFPRRCGMLHRHPLRTYSIPYMCLACRKAAGQRLASFEAKTIVHNIDTYVVASSPVSEHTRNRSIESISSTFRASKRHRSGRKINESGRNIADRAPAPGMPIPLKLISVPTPTGEAAESIVISGQVTPGVPELTSTSIISASWQAPSPRVRSSSTTSSISWWQRVTGNGSGVLVAPKTPPLPPVSEAASLQQSSDQTQLTHPPDATLSDLDRPVSTSTTMLDSSGPPITSDVHIGQKGAWSGLSAPASVKRDALGGNIKGMNKILGWTAEKNAALPGQVKSDTHGVEELEREGIVVKEIR